MNLIPILIAGVAVIFIYLIAKQPKINVVTLSKPEPQGPFIDNQEISYSISDIKQLILEISQEEKYNRPTLALAIARVESSFNPLAKNASDPSFGVMGLKFLTARYYVPWISNENDLYKPEINIRAGIRFLIDLQNKWENEFGLDGVIQMYNLGETKFLRGIRNSNYLSKVKSYL